MNTHLFIDLAIDVNNAIISGFSSTFVSISESIPYRLFYCNSHVHITS